MSRLDKPDRMIFDIDPGPDVVWPRVALAAVALRDLLADAGLESWRKATGGKGLHVVVPIERRSGWDEVKAFSRAVASSPRSIRRRMERARAVRQAGSARAAAPSSAAARRRAPV